MKYSYDRRPSKQASVAIRMDQLAEALEDAKKAVSEFALAEKKTLEIQDKIKALDSVMPALVKKQAALIGDMQEHVKKLNEVKPHAYLEVCLKQLDKLKSEARGDWRKVSAYKGPIYEASEVAMDILRGRKLARWRTPLKGSGEMRDFESFLQRKWSVAGKLSRDEAEKVSSEVKKLEGAVIDATTYASIIIHDDVPYDLKVLGEEVNFELDYMKYTHLSIVIPSDDMKEQAAKNVAHAKSLVKANDELIKGLEKFLFG